MQPTCLALLGPGLDGQLAIEVMRRAGWRVIAASLRTAFTNYSRSVEAAAQRLNVPLVCLEPGTDYYERIQHPRFGYTREMAPCLDCKVWMLTMARDHLGEFGATMIATGDVLGQRLPGQSKRDFALVDFHAGVEGQVVRPLSGKLLPDTGADRTLLLDLQGRGRQRQQSLAREWGWTEIPAVTSGCLLADHAYGRKYQEAMTHGEVDPVTVRLLAIGRHFRLGPHCRVVLSRNADEGLELISWHAQLGHAGALCTPIGNGPVALILGDAHSAIETVGRLILRYSRTELRDRCELVLSITRGSKEELRTIQNSPEPLPEQIA